MRALLLALVLAGFAPLARAQTFRVEEDVAFARGLVEWRLHDLARAVLDRILTDPNADSGDRALAQLELANLYKDQFTRGLTDEARLAAAEKADAAYAAFMRDFSDHPRIIDAKLEYAEFLVNLGRSLIRRFEQTLAIGGSRAEADTFRASALEKLKKAANLFDELKVVIDASGKKDTDYAEAYLRTEYYRAILYYFIGKAQKDEATRLATFQEGINVLEEYIFANEDKLLGYWGYLYKGLCHREFAEPAQREDALASFQAILFAFRRSIEDPSVRWQSWADVLAEIGPKNLVEATFWRYAETLNRFGRHQEALAKVQEMEKIYAEAKVRYGTAAFQALLEKAEAFFLLGDTNGAIATVSQVSEEAGTGNRFIQLLCDRALARYLEEVADRTQLDPDVIFKAAKGAFSQERYHDAIRHFQTVLAIVRGTGARALACWDYLSRAYESLGFPREAVLAASTGAFQLKTVDEERAWILAKRARRIMARLHRATRWPKDRDRLERLQQRIDTAFGTRSGARFEEAHRTLQEGNYDKAIRLFKAISPDAERYELARAFVSFAMVLKAETAYAKATRGRKSRARKAAAEKALREAYEEAIREADTYIAYAAKTRIVANPKRLANREQALGVAKLAKALALKGLERYDEALQVLDDFARGKVTNKDILEKAAVLRVYCDLGRHALTQAEKDLAALEKNHPGATKSIVTLKGLVGLEYAKKADTHEKAHATALALAALKKSVAYRAAWVKGSEPRINNLLALAVDLYRLNRFAEAETYLDVILEKWGRVERPSRRLAKPLRLARLYKARCLVWRGKYAEAEPILRALYEARKRDKRLIEEYARLLTGTVVEIDGRLVYIPGRGGHARSAIQGYKIWAQLKRYWQRRTGAEAIHEVLKAHFHQDLVRWALGRVDHVRQNLKTLRISYGEHLDRKPGAREPGYWERRFQWLVRQIRAHPRAPQTPPPPPRPR